LGDQTEDKMGSACRTFGTERNVYKLLVVGIWSKGNAWKTTL